MESYANERNRRRKVGKSIRSKVGSEWLPLLILMAGYVVITVSLIIAWVILGVKYLDYCIISGLSIKNCHLLLWSAIFPGIFIIVTAGVLFVFGLGKVMYPIVPDTSISEKTGSSEKLTSRDG